MELNNEAKEGFFVDKVFNKQKNKYGENQALKIKSSIKEIFNSCEDLMNSNDDNKNVLLIGKVQSGKTSNLEMISAFAFDNKYQCAIIYGGYDNSLLKQTCTRFKETFDIKDVNQIENNTAELFSTNDIHENDINTLDETIIKKLIQKNKPFFLISMKRPDAMNKITKVLNCIKTLNIKSFIIDDECDQASLNTKFRKNEESPTYSTIVEMKSLLNNPLYLAVTATPYANVLLSDISELIPNKLFLIHPGDGYTGADSFHLDDEKIIVISEKDVEQLDEDKIPKSLHDAIFYFLLTSVIIKIKLNKQDNYTDMIINTNRKNQNQNELYKQINQIINTLKNNFSDYISDFKQIYRLYFKKDIIEKYSFDNIKEELKNVIDDTHIVLQNSQGKETMTNLKYYFHKIYIGSDLLQRGLTFSNLITTYFTISPKITNIDTTLQRARWFGYRSEYIDFCKIFTTKKIQQDFVKLTETENDIWEQCKDIENSKLKISEIIINSGDTKFNPTRKNVAAYKKIIRTKRWICQTKGCFDIEINKYNNNIIQEFLNKFAYKDSYVATHNRTFPSCKYTEIGKQDLDYLIQHVNYIFDTEPLKSNLKFLKESNKRIIIEKMFGLKHDDNITPRLRSFHENDNDIYVLQQGKDSVNIENMKYEGDSKVIVDDDVIIIQIYWIKPRYKNNEFTKTFDDNYNQYMFAFYIPHKINEIGFVRDESY